MLLYGVGALGVLSTEGVAFIALILPEPHSSPVTPAVAVGISDFYC